MSTAAAEPDIRDIRESERAIYNLLTQDQCWFGMEHTTDQLCLWMTGNVRDGRKQFLQRMLELDAQLDGVGR